MQWPSKFFHCKYQPCKFTHCATTFTDLSRCGNLEVFKSTIAYATRPPSLTCLPAADMKASLKERDDQISALRLELAETRVVCDDLRKTADAQRLALSDARKATEELEERLNQRVEDFKIQLRADFTAAVEERASLLAAETTLLRDRVEGQQANVDTVESLKLTVDALGIDAERLREDLDIQKRTVSGMELGVVSRH